MPAAELDYLVDVDHQDHEAIIAVDQLSGEAVGVARYVRSNDDAEVAELAVTVIDDLAGARPWACAAHAIDRPG